ncbi:hypothetical protein [Brevundimonas sp.]|uniref:hypothetical protein n=1 Tax=Brevundimonas sp. TaxID=1871086 RepID=UPI003BA9F0E4
MNLDIWDAIRAHLVVELECDGVRHQLEPYECDGMGSPLRGYVLTGPELGWREFRDWNNLKITNRRFEARSDFD